MDTPAPSSAQPKTRRRWFSFSLRSLLIFVTLAGCGLGWLGFKVQEGRRQQAAVAAIKKLGAWVGYDYQFDSQGGYLQTDPAMPGPAWLHTLLGDDFFRNVYSVGLGASDGSDGQDRFVRWEVAEYANTHVTDADLDCLKGLTHLKDLNLYASQVTDMGMRNLRRLAHLEVLDLGNTQITDAGLEQLKGLRRLKRLRLDATQVTDVGMDELKESTQLEELRVDSTQVSYAGVAKIQRALPNCNIFWH